MPMPPAVNGVSRYRWSMRLSALLAVVVGIAIGSIVIVVLGIGTLAITFIPGTWNSGGADS